MKKWMWTISIVCVLILLVSAYTISLRVLDRNWLGSIKAIAFTIFMTFVSTGFIKIASEL